MNELTDGILISILGELLKRRDSIKIVFFIEFSQLFYAFLKLIVVISILTNTSECNLFYYFLLLLITDILCSIVNLIALGNLYYCDY